MPVSLFTDLCKYNDEKRLTSLYSQGFCKITNKKKWGNTLGRRGNLWSSLFLQTLVFFSKYQYLI